MSKTLLITVGTGRNRHDIAQALVFSIRHHQPEKVIFLCSQKTNNETMPAVCALWNDPKPQYDVMVTNNENDVQMLYDEYLAVARQYDDVIVDFTSGTKAMSAALFAVGISVQAGQVSYVIGPRDSGGRAIKSDNVISFKPELVIAERQLTRAKDLFNGTDFHAAWQLARYYARQLDKDTELGRLANTLYLLGYAYDCWDHFKWKEATNKINKLLSPQEKVIARLDRQQLALNKQFTRQAEPEQYSSARLVDLYQNTQRRFDQGRFDDALARMYRAYEFLIQWRLKNKYNLLTGDITLTQLQDKSLSPETMERCRRRADNNNGKFKLSLRDAMELLAEMGDQLGQRLIDMYWQPGKWQPNKKMSPQNDTGALQNWLNQRNSSWLAHGTEPAKSNTVKCMLNELENLLQDFVPDFTALKNASKMIKL